MKIDTDVTKDIMTISVDSEAKEIIIRSLERSYNEISNNIGQYSSLMGYSVVAATRKDLLTILEMIRGF
jgi:hypothetical protein